MSSNEGMVADMAPRRRLVRLGQVPTLYPISVSTLRRRIADGSLAAYRERRSICVDLDEVDAMFDLVSAPCRPPS